LTSENALVYGHPIEGGDSYVIETGTLARTLSWRTAEPDESLPKIEPPVELPQPLFANFDSELADATATAIAANDVEARRLLRALEWYVVAFSNSESVTRDVRVGAVSLASRR
jgi:hypothetical protein